MILKFLSLILIAFALFASSALAATDANNKIFSVCAQNPSSTLCKDKGSQNKDPKSDPVVHIIKVASDIVAILTGLAAVILIIIGGITMITSAGSAEAVANARKRILYAVIGLVIVTLAWTLVAFVTDKFIQ